MKYLSSICTTACIGQGCNLSVGQIQQALELYQPSGKYPGLRVGVQQAAILLPLFCKNNAWHVLFTRRTDSVNHHKGQVSFPGGVMDIKDVDLIQTALRESNEEIGLNPKDLMILGRLGVIESISGYLISPFVGVIPWPYELILSTGEVEKVFSIPLEWLAQPDNHEERTVVIDDKIIKGVLFYQEYQGEVLWGLSARIMLEFLSILDTSTEK